MPDLDAKDGLASLPGPATGGRLVVAEAGMAILRYLDVVLVALATPVALTSGVPALGFLLGSGGWVLQRALAQLDRRWIARAREPQTRLGLTLVESFGRIWLLAGAIVAAGVIGGRADGLTAALVIFVAYSIAFAGRLTSGRPPGGPQR